MPFQHFFPPKNSCYEFKKGKLKTKIGYGGDVYLRLVQTNVPLFLTGLLRKLQFVIPMVDLSPPHPPSMLLVTLRICPNLLKGDAAAVRGIENCALAALGSKYW